MFFQKPGTQLRALPDFSSFQFASPGATAPDIREVRFVHQEATDTYNLDLDDPSSGDTHPAPDAEDEDSNILMITLILIIELYTERYPDRTIRLKGNTHEKARLYRCILDKYVDILVPHFTIDLEQGRSGFFLRSRRRESLDNIAFLLKRKPGFCFSIHTIRTTLNSRSLLFDHIVSVELYRNIHVGVVQFEKAD